MGTTKSEDQKPKSKIINSHKIKEQKTKAIIPLLEQQYNTAQIALDYTTPFSLLVATILAAQCTDERVNKVTPSLFQLFPTPLSFAQAPIEEIEKAIYSTGFYKNKATSIKNASIKIIELHGGEVPSTMAELLELPGVGRKTANVLLGHCFNTPGIVVDTHVKRISNLVGIVNSTNPVEIEFQLMEVVPVEKWVIFSHLLASHGRAICVANRPKCGECIVNNNCDNYSNA